VAVLERGRLVALGTPAELARRLGRSQRLEVDVAPEDVPTTLRVLDARLGVADPEHVNGKIMVVGADREKIPGLVAALVGADVSIYGITPQEPSLEDVYFALQGDEVTW